VRINEPEHFFGGFWRAVADVWARRELLGGLIRKELKVKYTESALGFVWTLLRPLFILMIYFLVFGKFLKPNIPHFAFYLFAGLVPWDLFSVTLGAATASIVDNAGLIKKVYFPRELLPLAAIGAGLVQFAMQLVVLFALGAAFRFDFLGPNLLLLPLALLCELAFITAMSLFLAAVNVYLRDVQFLLEVFLLFWFWMTPIVYQVGRAYDSLHKRALFGVTLWHLYLIDPMANVIIFFQRAIYKHVSLNGTQVLYPISISSLLVRMGIVMGASGVLIWLAQRLFARAQGNFAQEL
jgi:ABC-2 type transport system permease protein